MICRIFVDDGQLVPKLEVKVRWNDVDVVPQTETHSGPRWDSDHVLIRLWLAYNAAESDAADDHSYSCNHEKDQHGSRGAIRTTVGNPHP